MVEAQSRYAIMADLNEKKVETQQELTDLELKKQDEKRKKQEKIDSLEKELSSREATFENDHKVWRQRRLVEIELIKGDKERQVKAILEQIKTNDEAYVDLFLTWKQATLETIKVSEKDLEVYRKQINSVIQMKKDVLKELDAGIKSLKEISKDQKE